MFLPATWEVLDCDTEAVRLAADFRQSLVNPFALLEDAPNHLMLSANRIILAVYG